MGIAAVLQQCGCCRAMAVSRNEAGVRPYRFLNFKAAALSPAWEARGCVA